MPPSALPVALLLVICVACASMSAAARPGGGGHWGGGGLRLPAIPHAAPYSSTPRIAPYVPPPRIAPRFSLPSAPHISAPRIAPPRLAPTIAHVPSVAPFPPQQLARPAPFPQGPGMTGQISSAHAPTGGIQRIALPTVQQARAFAFGRKRWCTIPPVHPRFVPPRLGPAQSDLRALARVRPCILSRGVCALPLAASVAVARRHRLGRIPVLAVRL
jgi:hypothetical protein